MTTLILEEILTAKSDNFGDMHDIRRCFVRPGNVVVNVFFKLEYEKDGLMYYSYSYTIEGAADAAEIKSWLRSLTIRAPWKATGNARAIVLERRILKPRESSTAFHDEEMNSSF